MTEIRTRDRLDPGHATAPATAARAAALAAGRIPHLVRCDPGARPPRRAALCADCPLRTALAPTAPTAPSSEADRG